MCYCATSEVYLKPAGFEVESELVLRFSVTGVFVL